MDLAKTLDMLNATLAGPKVTAMTKAQFEEYAQAQIAKAKEESDEDAEKSKKRLAHLKSTMDTLAKAEGTPLTGAWTGDNGTALIPEYEMGVEDSTRKGERSETEVSTPPAGNQGTAGEGSSAFSNGAPTYDQQPQGFSASGTNMPGSGSGTQGDNTIFQDGTAIGKSLEEIKKKLAGVQPAPVTTTKAAAPPPKQDYAWPSDLANEEYLKDGVLKRAPDHWGPDANGK